MKMAPADKMAPVDLDRLIGDDPKAKQAARATHFMTMAGEMVRRARTAHEVSQPELARRTGCTQAHISELERGLGSKGPTVATLGRIMDELGEELVIETASAQAAKQAAKRDAQVADAKSWLERLCAEVKGVPDPHAVQAGLMHLLDNLKGPDAPLKEMAIMGMLAGFEAASVWSRSPVGWHGSLVYGHDLCVRDDPYFPVRATTTKVELATGTAYGSGIASNIRR
jgi:transcriptional regulator with XRE-family HTH domain